MQQQIAGNQIRKIDVSAYTITGSSNGAQLATSNASSTKASGSLKIENPRFKFENQIDIPKPHKYEGRIKLYPSGRGSSMPLNLSDF